MFVRVAVATCLLLGLVAGPAAGDTSFTVEQRVPLAGGNTNDCTGEFFTITGYFHTKVHMSMTLDGRTNTTTEFNLESVKGVALSGARYVETAETSTMWNRDLDMVPQTSNYKSDVLMNRLGEDGSYVLGDDSYTMVLVHYTVNANGTTTVDRMDVTITCR
ncbi:MAG TPA: hypothetical protein VIP07_10670 [Candidatus Limnocylindria bacterium]